MPTDVKNKKNDQSTSVDQGEIEHFSKDSNHWWDEQGPFKPLHRLNPVRLKFIKQQICDHYDRDFDDLKALTDLNIIDIGCGGGLVCEPLARMGATVTGVDADKNAISVATDHAENASLNIQYISDDIQDIGKQYDIVLALEVIEHVNDISLFMEQIISVLKPEGLLIMSTLNRTPKSYALGIIAAEHILRWVPKGTHSWKKFVKPSEISGEARKHGLKPQKIKGLIFNPLKNEFSLSETDLDVNYLIALSRDSL